MGSCLAVSGRRCNAWRLTIRRSPGGCGSFKNYHRTLFCSLPPAGAAVTCSNRSASRWSEGRSCKNIRSRPGRVTGLIHLALRQLVAAAAMIALLAFLGAIVYQVVAPVSGPEPTTTVVLDLPAIPSTDTGGRMPPMRVEDKGFVGRLEFQTPLFVSTDAFIQRAIDTSLA